MFAYIPARGGSKRVPGKNIRTLGGRPVLAHVLQTLQKVPGLTDVFVSTDDPAIARVAETNGARWLGPRDPELSNDKAGFIDLIHRDIPRHADAANAARDVLFVLALAALVPGKVFAAACEAFQRHRPNLLMSVVPCTKSPYWSLVPDATGHLVPLFPEWVYVNSQDLPVAYDDAGLFYVFDWYVLKSYDSHKNMPGLLPFPVDRSHAIDVDTEDDWNRLETAFRQRHCAS